MSTVLPPFQQFLDNAVRVIQQDSEALGLAVGGSWASGDVDAYSDLDLVLVTRRPVAPNVELMREYASRLGPVLGSFRGDHVGEPRLLIALYDRPLLHVDIKFLTLPEFHQRVEDPVIVWERNGALTTVIRQSAAQYPDFDFQWAEDRFWIWVHYALLKIGRGEYVEALDFLAFLRGTVLGPMLHLRNGNRPRGVRRIETSVGADELISLNQTIGAPDRNALIGSLEVAMHLYETLRDALAPGTLQKNGAAQSAVWAYLRTTRQLSASSLNR